MKGWGYYILAAIGFVVYGVAMDVDSDDSVDSFDSVVVEDTSVDESKLQVGDCFNDAGTFDRQKVSDPSVPCSEPHDNETFAVFNVDYESFPADGSMGKLAYDACMVHFESYVGKAYDNSPLMIGTIQPDAESWGQGNREVICAVFDMKTKPLVGSMAGRSL